MTMLELAPPRFSTPLDSSRKNLLTIYRRVAKAMGWQQLQPWQEYVVKLATEIDDETGMPAYSEIDLTLPRQNGKSVLMSLVFLVRLLAWPAGGRQVVMLGAQDALSARRLLVDDVWKRLNARGLAQAAGMRLRQGGFIDLRMKNGNHLYLMTSNVSSGHGTTLSTAIVDECWALQSDAALQAAGPAMITVPDSQLWLCSTMGDDSSTFWQRRVDRGRATSLSARAGKTRTAYVEWSAPDDSDCDDPAVWRAANPAFGELISHESVLSMRESQTESAFRRSVLNQIVRNAALRVIPDHSWADCQQTDLDLAAPAEGVVIGVDATPERRASSVVAADATGRIEVVAHREGADWIAELAESIYRYHGDIVGIAVLSTGPLNGIIEVLEQKRVPVFKVTSSQSATASGLFYDAALAGALKVRPDVGLDSAVAAATMRTVGQSWAWGRASIDDDVSPLIASSLAYAVATTEASRPSPRAPQVIDLSEASDELTEEEQALFDEEVEAWSQIAVS